MSFFKDKAGTSWEIDLTIGAAIRIKRADSRFNLLDPSKDNLHERLHLDLGEFWEFLWALIEPQAIAKQIDAEKFGEMMTPECLMLAQGEFFKDWALFLRGLQRIHEAVAIEKLGAYQKKAVQLVTAKLEGQEMATMDAEVERKMNETLNKSFGSFQALLASNPAPSPSES